jgi:hypothetical protein
MAEYAAGQAYLTILPDLSGFGQKVREELAKDDFTVKPKVEPEKPDPAKSKKDGEEYGGAFGDAMRARIDAALKDLPKPVIDADSSEADRKIDGIRTRLEELRDKRIGIDITGAEATAEIAKIKAELDELGAKNPDVQVKVDALKAAADLAGLRAEISALDGKNVDIKVDDKGSAGQATSNINALMLAGISLGPAIIPVAAAVAAAIGAIGTGAIVGVAAIGTIKAAFTGIGTAVKDLDTAQQQQGQNASQLHAQQVSSANSVASAQDGVRNAVRSLSDAEHAASLASQAASQAVATARRGVGDAYIQTGIAINGALRSEQQAEQTLAGALQQVQLAQESLTLARQAAQRQIESLTLSVEDGALAERQAQLSIQTAKQQLDQTLANPTATLLQREQAQLSYDQAVQQLKDVQARNKNLAQDKAAADAKGVEGSQQVQAAQRGVASATQSVSNAQQGLAAAQANVDEVRRQGTERIAVANQTLTDAIQKQTETQRTNNENIQKAQEGIVTANRALVGALAQQAVQQNTVSSSAKTLAQDMAKLSPAGQEFAHFVHDDLTPKIKSLQATAQQGLLPGVETGLKAMFPVFPEINALVGTTATSLGDLATRAGRALNDPFWRGFFSYIKGEAGPTIHTFGDILGNLARGGAGLIEAFKPVWDQMGAGLDNITGKFATFGQNAGSNSGFQQFLAYVKQEGPVVVSLIGDLLVMFGNLGRALGPLGGIVLGLVDGLVRLIANTPTPVLQVLVPLLWGGYEAWKAWQIVKTITQFMTEYEVITKLGAVATGAYELATAGATYAMGALRGAQIGSTIAAAAQATWQGIVTVATGAWTAAQWLLNTAMEANPLVWLGLLIAGLVVGVIYAYNHWQTFHNIVVACWDGIKVAADWTWNSILKPVFDQMGSDLRNLGDLWHIFLDVINVVWSGIKIVFDALTGNWQGVVNAFNSGMNSLRDIWNRLIDIAKVPVNFVIGTVYNSGIVPVWNGIAGVFGLGKLNPAALLAEGGVIPGYAPGVDDVPIMASRGEGILVPEAVRALGADFIYQANAQFSGGRSAGGLGSGNRFAGGGIVGAASSAWDAISGVFTDPVGTIKRVFAGIVGAAGHIPGVGFFHDALVAVPGKVIDAVTEKAKALVAAMLTGGGPGGSVPATGAGVEQWRGVGLAALTAEGQAVSNIGRLLYQMQTESGGNPNAVNRSDINWQKGTPSVGLMQVIGPTYQHYKDPRFDAAPFSYGASIDPMSNIAASIRYTLGAYGSLASGWQGHGYDSGGWLPPGLTMAYNGTGQKERVLTGPQFDSLSSAASHGGSQPINIHVYPRAEHSEADIADMVSRRLSFSMRAVT